jgi:hypothetical protein
MRFMMLIKVEEGSGPAEPSQELMVEMGKLMEEMNRAGVLLETAGLRPTEEGTRVHWDHGKLDVLDGPFAEAKEVVGGYSIVQAKSREEAVEWAKRFVRIHGDDWEVTTEIRQIEEPPEDWS